MSISYSAYSQTEYKLSPVVLHKNDTLYYGFNTRDAKELGYKKTRLEFLEKEYLTLNTRLLISIQSVTDLNHTVAQLSTDKETLKGVIATRNETIKGNNKMISNNNKKANNLVKAIKKQNKALKIIVAVLGVIVGIK